MNFDLLENRLAVRAIGAFRLVLAAAVVALTLGSGAASAQAGPVPKSPAPSAGAPSADAPADGKAAVPSADDLPRNADAIRKDLDAARNALDAIEGSPDKALGAPPGTPASAIGERLTLTRQLVTLLQQQLDWIDRIDVARAERINAERTERDWSGFPTPPPYSVLAVDAIRDTLEGAEARIASAASRQALFERFTDTVGGRAKASQGAARLAMEAADRARGSPAQAGLEWQRDLATLHARVNVATQDLLRMGNRAAREETAAAQATRDLALRQLAAAGNQIAFPEADLARVRRDIEARQRRIEAEIAVAARAAAAAQEARAAADNALAAAQAAPPRPDENAAARAANLNQLERALDVKREEAITATIWLDLLKGYLVVLDGEQAVWQGRAEALKMQERMQVRAVYERLTAGIATIRAWGEYINQQLVAVRARVLEQDRRVRAADGPGEAAAAQQLLDTYRKREGQLVRALEVNQPLERLVARFRADFEERREASVLERARDAAAGAWFLLRRSWNFELFTVADSFETSDGRRIDVERSVTIGKTVGAVLIVIVGYLLCNWITRRIELLLVARGHIAPQSAALLRNWMLFLLTVILVIVALVGSSIPLTVFAFLGGALAIAAGFGLQTLLKNFVAGIMLLVERPMRLGDLVEVDGIRGRVTAIGIRASTILSADGIETMIPNGAFIENKLTNWTYSNPNARQSLTIGVAYGTPLRKAAEVMQEALERHGLVLKDPAPQVYVNGFADSAIEFTLAYWVEMSPTNDLRRIKSDILHMLDRALADAGFAIPFPQRDVHLK